MVVREIPDEQRANKEKGSLEMFRNQKSKNHPADYFREESEPRPPPRVAHFPMPFNQLQECPKPVVPDVSIIFNPPEVSPYVVNTSQPIVSSPSSNAQVQNSSILRRSQSRTEAKGPDLGGTPLRSVEASPCASPPTYIDSALIQELIILVKTQSVAINTMKEQLDRLVEAYDNSNNHGSSCTLSPLSSTSNSKVDTKFIEKAIQVNLQDSQKSTPELKLNKITDSTNQKENEKPNISFENTSDDVSKFLRDANFKLPQVEENTIYSVDTSAIRHIEMPEYEDDDSSIYDGDSDNRSSRIGQHVSTYDSSADENEHRIEPKIVKPPELLYRNVLEDVNNYLENRDELYNSPSVSLKLHRKKYKSSTVPSNIQELQPSDNNEKRGISRPYNPCLAPKDKLKPTESTLYGLSSKHLSFSTKQYLERHGLVHSRGKRNPPGSPKVFENEDIGNQRTSLYTDRILDITALKNQSKLT